MVDRPPDPPKPYRGPGNPNLKPGPGRPPGSKNRANFLAKEYLDWRQFNPLDELILWYQNESHPADTRVRALSELLDRYAPRLKSITVEHQGQTPLSNVQINIIAGPQSAPGPVIDVTPAETPAAIEHAATLPVTGHEWANLRNEIPIDAWDQDQNEDNTDG